MSTSLEDCAGGRSVPRPARYRFEALSNRYTIRLLKLQTTLIQGTLAFTIEHFSRAQHELPAFHALSYCWGNPTPIRKIYLNHSAHYVHSNLWILLQLMWQKQMFEHFWTDCLSLDQSNKYELGEQIPMMKHVYSGAKNVFLFLGGGAMEEKALSDFQYNLSPQHQCSVMGDSPEVQEERQASDEVLEAAQILLNLPFWQRIWIIQEIVLASHGTLLAGTSSMALETFFAKLLPLLEHRILASIPAALALKRMHHYRNRHQPKTPLSNLLEDFSRTFSTHPADKVYGLLSLVSKPPELARRLNVRKGKPAAHVFWDVVLECSFPDFHLRQIMAVLAPMYSEQDPDMYIMSLEKYSVDDMTSARHQEDAATILSVVYARHALVKNFTLHTDAAESALRWPHVFDSLATVPVGRADPEIDDIARVHRSQWFFWLGLDLADLTSPLHVGLKALSLVSGGWKARDDFWDIPWSIVNHREPIKSLSSSGPRSNLQDMGDVGYVFSFEGGRLGLWIFGLTRYGTLCSQFFEEGTENTGVAKRQNGSNGENSMRRSIRSFFGKSSKK